MYCTSPRHPLLAANRHGAGSCRKLAGPELAGPVQVQQARNNTTADSAAVSSPIETGNYRLFRASEAQSETGRNTEKQRSWDGSHVKLEVDPGFFECQSQGKDHHIAADAVG
jgi:hypothetical protein